MLRNSQFMAVIVILLILFCFSREARTADKGGTLRCLENEIPDTYDPITSTNMAALRLTELMFESLLSETQSGDYEGRLADNFSFTSDSLSVTFHLKQNVKWCEFNQDGEMEATQPFTAEDVLYTYELMKSPKTYIGSSKWKGLKEVIKEARVLDNHTIEFKLSKTKIKPEENFTFKIVPKYKIKGGFITKDDPFAYSSPVGTGYYCFFEDHQDVKILKVNRAYYSEQANIDQIKMEYYFDETNIHNIALYGGKQSICAVVQARVKDIAPYISSGDYEIRRYAPLNFSYLGYNLKNNLFRDRRVRQALTYAIDRKSILELKFLDKGEVVSGPYPPGSALTNPDVEVFPYDTAMAKRLLREAGFKEAGGGWMKDRKRLSFTLTVRAEKDATAWSAAQHIKDYWDDIGVEVKLERLTGPTWRQKVYLDRDFEVTYGGWRCDRATDIRPLFRTGTEKNFVSYSNPVVDSLVNLLDDISIPEERRDINWKLHRILAEDCPYTFLWSLYRYAAISKKVNRSDEIHDFNFFGYINRWWIPESEQWRQ